MSENISKTPPKGKIKFSINLSEEQKIAKSNILIHPYNFVIGKAGSGKCITYESKIDIKINEKFYAFLIENGYIK